MATEPIAQIGQPNVQAIEPTPDWPLGTRIAFRFAFAYLVLYIFLFPFGASPTPTGDRSTHDPSPGSLPSPPSPPGRGQKI